MPTAPPYAANVMRRRAADLRSLARRIEHSTAMTLPPLADERTWIGPSPQRCCDDLQRTRTNLRQCCDDLRLAARRLERQADEIEAQSRLIPPRI